MFTKVCSARKKEMFNEVWKDIAQEIGSSFKEIQSNSTAYILTNSQDVGVGTVEFIPYHFEANSYVDAYFPFSKVLDPRMKTENIHIIAKLGIKQEFRKQGYFQELINLISEFSIQNNTPYFIANINKDVYRILRFMYKGKIDIIGKEFHPTENVTMCPVLIHMEESLKKNANETWFQQLDIFAHTK